MVVTLIIKKDELKLIYKEWKYKEINDGDRATVSHAMIHDPIGGRVGIFNLSLGLELGGVVGQKLDC